MVIRSGASEDVATPMDIQTRLASKPGVHKFSGDLGVTSEFYKFHTEDLLILGATDTWRQGFAHRY